MQSQRDSTKIPSVRPSRMFGIAGSNRQARGRPITSRRIAAISSAILLVMTYSSFLQHEAATTPTMRPEIRGSHGIIAAGRHYAVEAGMRMFRQGGNAVDAGVAGVFAAAVTELSHFGFGGEVPILIHDPESGRTVVINGQGPAPAAASAERFEGMRAIPGNGPLGTTVPAVMDSLALALEHFGTLSLTQVMEPAVELADGFVMYGLLQSYFVTEQEASSLYPSTLQTYYPGGRASQVGEIFRQPNLARTLRALVAAEARALQEGASRAQAIRAGRDEFYSGTIGRRIAAAVQNDGGLLTYEDMAGFGGRIEEPAVATFHGYEIYKAGFWNQGPAMLQTLNILEGLDLREMGHGSTLYIHTVTEAIKLAYADRDTYYADPDFAEVPTVGLLSKDYAAERRKQIDRSKAEEGHRPGDPYPFDSRLTRPEKIFIPQSRAKEETSEDGDTTCVNAVDRTGLLFSATPSSGWLIEGAYIAGDTGVPMSNRMQAFSPDPRSPNRVEGSKRPRTTLTPTIVLKDGRPFLAVSTPGGDSQDQQILNVLLSLLVFEMPLQEAVEAPRINSLHMFASFRDHANEPLVLQIEDRIAPGVIRALEEKGHKIRLLGPFGMGTGITAVGVDPDTGTLRGAADVRRERYAAGW